MKYLDSNVFIFSFTAENKNSELCKAILEKVASGAMRACTSALAWDESVWIAKKVLGRRDALDEGKKFLEFPYMTFLEISEATARLAQSMMEKYDLDPRDALHAAAAMLAGAKEIITNDPDFDQIKELKRIALEEAAK